MPVVDFTALCGLMVRFISYRASLPGLLTHGKHEKPMRAQIHPGNTRGRPRGQTGSESAPPRKPTVLRVLAAVPPGFVDKRDDAESDLLG